MAPITIVVTPRPQTTACSGYYAQIEDRPEILGNGQESDEAVGNLVRLYSEQFSLQNWPGLIDNPELGYKDVGRLVRRDSEKLGINIVEIGVL